MDGSIVIPITISLGVSGDTGEGFMEDSLSIAEKIAETMRDYYALYNSEPITQSGFWAEVTGIGTRQSSSENFYIEYTIGIDLHKLLDLSGEVGTVEFEYDSVSVTIPAENLSVKITEGKPKTTFSSTTNLAPRGQDRRSASVVFRVKGTLVGVDAYTDTAKLINMFNTKIEIGNIDMTFTGYLATAYGSTHKVMPINSSCLDMEMSNGSQWRSQISSLVVRVVN